MLVAEWTPQDWALFLTAVGTLVSAVLAAVAAFIANLAKMKGDLNSDKIDENTKITKQGNAAVASSTQKTTDKVAEISDKLNGNLDEKIHGIVRGYVDPITKEFNSHVQQTDKNIVDIKQSLSELKEMVKK